MKYSDYNHNIQPEYVNTFRIYPNDSEVVIDFAHIDYAATRLKAESDGREKPEDILMNTKARLVLSPQMLIQLKKALDSMIPEQKEAEPNDGKENISADSGDRSADL